MSRSSFLGILVIALIAFIIPEVVVPGQVAADEDKVLNEQVLERALAQSKSILRPHDELPILELKKQVRAPYEEERERFRAWLKEEFAREFDERWDEFVKARDDHARDFSAKAESHCVEAMGDERFHEARIVHELIHGYGSYYDGDGHRARARIMAYDTYLRLARQTSDRLAGIGERLIALHAGDRDPGFELAVVPPEDDWTNIDRLEEKREELATWLQERKHGYPDWPDHWHVEAGWSCRVGDRDFPGQVFGVDVNLTNRYKPLAQQMQEQLEEMIRGNSWKLNAHAQSLGGRAAALNRFDEVMEVRAGSRFVVFRPRWIEQAFVVLLPDGCDALLVGVYASRDWPDDLVRRNPIVVDEIVGLLLEAFVGGGGSTKPASG